MCSSKKQNNKYLYLYRLYLYIYIYTYIFFLRRPLWLAVLRLAKVISIGKELLDGLPESESLVTNYLDNKCARKNIS